MASKKPEKPAKADQTLPKPAKPSVVEGQRTRCTTCGSTEREPYHGVIEQAIAGVDPKTGQLYTHVVWRRTRCRDCGKNRVDRSYENRPVKKKRAG